MRKNSWMPWRLWHIVFYCIAVPHKIWYLSHHQIAMQRICRSQKNGVFAYRERRQRFRCEFSTSDEADTSNGHTPVLAGFRLAGMSIHSSKRSNDLIGVPSDNFIKNIWGVWSPGGMGFLLQFLSMRQGEVTFVANRISGFFKRCFPVSAGDCLKTC